MAATPQHTSLSATEKGEEVYTNDVNSSQLSAPTDLDDYPDPDVGKSAEERARLVSCAAPPSLHHFLTLDRTRLSSGRWTCG